MANVNLSDAGRFYVFDEKLAAMAGAPEGRRGYTVRDAAHNAAVVYHCRKRSEADAAAKRFNQADKR